ncbi:MATE family efflux transporter [Halocatena marina]|uniref:MATE family efflux transporter n=1 Tax=Halocatena marina TaxID=2934937 RepID=UPI002224FD83|nr:MATE family efflux transporter [Halocatena marina]
MTAAADEQADRFTDGAILWPLLTLAGPLVATQLLQVTYNFTDTFWVGQLGADAVSALSFSWPLVLLVISVGSGITNAGTILVSQNTGAGDDERVTHIAGQTLAFVSLLAIGLSVLGVIIAPQLLALVGATPGTEIHHLAVTYTRIVFLGIPFTFGFFIFQSLLRGWGDVTTPMYLVTGSVVLNVVLDPFFLLGFEGNPLFAWFGLSSLQAWLFAVTGFAGFGVEGAAVATVLSRGLAAAVGLWLLFSGRTGLHLTMSDLRLHLKSIWRLLRIGIPASIDQSTQAVSVTVMTALAALAGANAVAAYGIGNRFTTLVWFPTIAMGMAVETMVGQNLGNSRPDRARRTVYVAIALFATIFIGISAATVWFAQPIVNLFITGQEADAVVRHGVDYLRIIAPTWAIMAAFHIMNGAFYGAGSTELSMALGVGTLWGMRATIAIGLVVVVGFGATGVWYGIALSNVIAAIAGTVFFVRGRWSENILESDRTQLADANQS